MNSYGLGDRLEKLIEEMRDAGSVIREPSRGEHMGEFKEKESIVDGYPVVLHYQKADYGKHLMETLQVYGRNSPFLPFKLVLKLARRFLGSHQLTLVELFRENRKIYIWSVFVDVSGRPIDIPYEIEREALSYEGFEYNYMQPNQVNFY